MAKFNEINLPSYTPADGKKRFNCAAMQLCQIANRPIQILSVETDVQTKYGLRHLPSSDSPGTQPSTSSSLTARR